jgi:hypothetical protein
VRNLVAPDWDAYDDYEQIVTRSYRPERTSREEFRLQVQQQYREYLQSAPNVGGLTSVVEGEPARRHLRSCYDHPHMADVKARILALQQRADQYLFTHCQLCSGMYLAVKWDHYLPQSRFPEFAACAYNLIRICTDCNEHKNDEGTIGALRAIVHSYYDLMPDHACYLRAEITLVDGDLHAGFEPCMPEEGDGQFFDLYSRHFAALHLAERFAAYYSVELRRIANQISRYWALGLERETIQIVLQASAQDERDAASWPVAALLRAAADSDSFLEYARQGAQR